MNRKLLVLWILGISSIMLTMLTLAPTVSADGPVIEKQSFQQRLPRLGPQPFGFSKSYGNATVTLTNWMRYYDYGNSEDVSGRNTSNATNVVATDVNYLEAGGCLLKGGYGGQQMECRDTNNIPRTLSVDSGWTAYYRGYNQLWINTGHSYWDIWVGSYRWINNVWGDNSHQF